MIRGYKYKLDLTKKQEKQLFVEMNAARYIYNNTLGYTIKLLEEYKEYNEANPNEKKKRIDYNELVTRLKPLKKEEGKEFLKEATAAVLQQSVKNLEAGLKKCFSKQGGFPKFKKRGTYPSIKHVQNISIDFINKRITIPKIGLLKFYRNEEFGVKTGDDLFEPSTHKITSITISYDKLDGFYVSLCVDDGKGLPDAKLEDNIIKSIGIDVGIKTYATLSDGSKYDNPKYFETDEKKLKKLSKDLSRSRKGSKRYEKKRVRLARWHRKIANKRKDFLHKLTDKIVDDYDLICVEDLKVSNMIKNRKLSKAIASCSWSTFFTMLQYKAERRGKTISKSGTFEPTSKTCSCCGYKNKELKLSERSWECPECLTEHDRDVNAAKNIERLGVVNAVNVEVHRILEIAMVESLKREDSKSNIIPDWLV
jgi:putative transposase